MKYQVIFLIGLCLTACILKRETEYQMPEGITEQNKKEFVLQFNQGKTIYQLSCATCHNKEVNGKIVVPEFTAVQLETYSIRIKGIPHMKNLSVTALSEEDLVKVIFYLTNKKKKQADKK